MVHSKVQRILKFGRVEAQSFNGYGRPETRLQCDIQPQIQNEICLFIGQNHKNGTLQTILGHRSLGRLLFLLLLLATNWTDPLALYWTSKSNALNVEPLNRTLEANSQLKKSEILKNCQIRFYASKYVLLLYYRNQPLYQHYIHYKYSMWAR